MKYGMPYMGSKNSIAEKLIDILPDAECFVDLFAGGCAMTHCAILSGKYDKIIFNDISPGLTQMFVDAMHGKYKDERRWISRDDFHRLKAGDPYIRYRWSFGNNGVDYMYSTKIEPYKKACHYAIVFDEWDLMNEIAPEITDDVKAAVGQETDLRKRRIACMNAVKQKIKGCREMQNLECLERVQLLENLSRLSRLQNLERLEKDYKSVCIPENAVVYCDIPYESTHGYTGRYNTTCFSRDEFVEWCVQQPFPVYVSSYDFPIGDCIAEINRKATIASDRVTDSVEKLFVVGKEKEIKKSPQRRYRPDGQMSLW